MPSRIEKEEKEKLAIFMSLMSFQWRESRERSGFVSRSYIAREKCWTQNILLHNETLVKWIYECDNPESGEKQLLPLQRVAMCENRSHDVSSCCLEVEGNGMEWYDTAWCQRQYDHLAKKETPKQKGIRNVLGNHQRLIILKATNVQCI